MSPAGSEVREAQAAQRIDKWLCFARVVKTRSLAARLVAAGHVRVDGVRARDCAKVLRGGEVLTIALERQVRLLRVVGEADRRGPFRDAARLYEDLGEPRGDVVCERGPSACHAAANGLGSGLEKGTGDPDAAPGERI